MADESYKFRCKYCSQRLRAFDDLCGEEIECPRCNEILMVISRSEAAKREPFANEDERLFSVEELLLLKFEDKAIFSITDGATSQNCWEFGLAGQLMHERLRPFRSLLLDTDKKQVPSVRDVKSQAPFIKNLDSKVDEYLVLANAMHALVIDVLHERIYQDRLDAVIEFVHAVSDSVVRLMAFHQGIFEMELPNQKPYTSMLELMKGWAGFCWEHLDGVAVQMEDIYVNGMPKDGGLVQFAVLPPSFYQFMLLRANLA
ncbi:MAG: phage FluMu protein Com [Rhodothermales bacterium]|jgi:phage FluMu protein Com